MIDVGAGDICAGDDMNRGPARGRAAAAPPPEFRREVGPIVDRAVVTRISGADFPRSVNTDIREIRNINGPAVGWVESGESSDRR